MTGDWQDVAALVVVLGAFAYLVRFTRGLSGGTGGGCHSGGCGGCPAAKGTAAGPAPDGFVSLDGLKATRPR